MANEEILISKDPTEEEIKKKDLNDVGKKVDINGVDISDIKKPEKKVNKELDELLGDYKEAPKPDFNSPDINPFADNESDDDKPKKRRRRRKKSEPQIISGEIITGAMFLTLIDMFLPMIIGALHNYFGKGKISPHAMKMTTTQKNELEPIVEEVMKKWEIKADPVAILLISIFSIYGVNYLNARADI